MNIDMVKAIGNDFITLEKKIIKSGSPMDHHSELFIGTSALEYPRSCSRNSLDFDLHSNYIPFDLVLEG